MEIEQDFDVSEDNSGILCGGMGRDDVVDVDLKSA